MRELILYYLPNVDTIFDTFFIRFGPMKLKLYLYSEEEIV